MTRLDWPFEELEIFDPYHILKLESLPDKGVQLGVLKSGRQYIRTTTATVKQELRQLQLSLLKNYSLQSRTQSTIQELQLVPHKKSRKP